MVSVIIPAHNEADVIGRCLGTLLEGADETLEVIVVCNACSDDTAAIARSFGERVRVLETDVPGKPNALNMGDRAAHYFPRVYVDADVVMSADSVYRVADVLREGDVHAAAPRLKVNLEERNWFIRSYYRIWTQLPYCREEMVGSGVYALSEEGRGAFGDFPELLAEDDFIRLTFPKHKRRQVADATFQIEAPTTFRALLKIRCRWARSNDQVDDAYPQLRQNDERDYSSSLRDVLSKPTLWPAAGLYTFVVLYTRMVGKLQIRFAANPWNWTRDLTARQYAGTQATTGAADTPATLPDASDRAAPEPANTRA